MDILCGINRCMIVNSSPKKYDKSRKYYGDLSDNSWGSAK